MVVLAVAVPATVSAAIVVVVGVAVAAVCLFTIPVPVRNTIGVGSKCCSLSSVDAGCGPHWFLHNRDDLMLNETLMLYPLPILFFLSPCTRRYGDILPISDLSRLLMVSQRNWSIGEGGVLSIMHGRSRMTIEPRIPTTPGRTSGFQRQTPLAPSAKRNVR